MNHIIFTHVYTPVWESLNDSMKTMQRILTCHDPSRDSFPIFQEKCSNFLEACGEREALSGDYCMDVNQALWVLLSAMIEAEEVCRNLDLADTPLTHTLRPLPRLQSSRCCSS